MMEKKSIIYSVSFVFSFPVVSVPIAIVFIFVFLQSLRMCWVQREKRIKLLFSWPQRSTVEKRLCFYAVEYSVAGKNGWYTFLITHEYWLWAGGRMWILLCSAMLRCSLAQKQEKCTRLAQNGIQWLDVFLDVFQTMWRNIRKTELRKVLVVRQIFRPGHREFECFESFL